MAVRVSVKADLGRVKSRTERMTKLGQFALANQVLADSNNYAPFLSGDLRNQSTIGIVGKTITWNVPYARRQYHNIGAKFSTTGTGPKWDQKAKAIHGSSWIGIVKAAMK